MEYHDGGWDISYEESAMTGLEGVTTTFRVEPGKVVLSRTGTLQSKMVFQEGVPYEIMRLDIREYMKKTHLLFSLESLTNLARNGRVSPAVAKIAGVLGIRVVGVASDVGTLQQLHKCRGEKKALDTLFEEMVSRGYKGGKVCIAHCFNMDAAQALKEKILESYQDAQVDLEPTGALCSFYAEQGGLLVGFEG